MIDPAQPGHMQAVNHRLYKNIKMCHVNIQSLGAGDQGITSTANYKLDQIRTILQINEQFDVIGLSETWLTEAVSDEDISLDNYLVYRKDRQHRGGGVCTYVRTSISSKRRPDLEKDDLELIWIELMLKPKSILVGVSYQSG